MLKNDVRITTDQTVAIENLSETEQRLFYAEMLIKLLDLHRQEREKKA